MPNLYAAVGRTRRGIKINISRTEGSSVHCHSEPGTRHLDVTEGAILYAKPEFYGQNDEQVGSGFWRKM